jgi:putative glutamine amidotransferase
VNRPLIAISARPRKQGEVRGWTAVAGAAMQYTYLESIWRAGGREMMLAPRVIDVTEAREVLRRADGLILVGGGDVDPARYGQERHESVYDVEDASDALEMSLALAAIELRVPMFAICRGMQVLNVALGGTLHQHITRGPGIGPHGDPSEGAAVHPVDVSAGSTLAASVGGSRAIDACWSYHHQAIDRLADGLVVSARSSDGTVEAVELADRSAAWTLAVQWHPERTSDSDPVQQGLFDELIRQAARARRG